MSEVTTYFPSGGLQSRLVYIDGKLSGLQELYFPNGLLRRQTQYVAGLRHGIDVAWDSSGGMVFCEEWNRGKRVKVLVEDMTVS